MENLQKHRRQMVAYARMLASAARVIDAEYNVSDKELEHMEGTERHRVIMEGVVSMVRQAGEFVKYA